MEVSVHEINLPITSNAINEFFELPDFENDEYSSLMSNIKFESLQEILEELTVPAGDFVLQQRVEDSEDLEEEEEDPTEIELIQSAEIPYKAEPMELESKPDVTTSIFKTQSPRLDLRD
ncbi:hypothetical protein PVK06_048142 [Gossypium arboreum]|uniref:Uncharacterized protein n=1 Tax=Gossypium arboreum TaxID=29729 RepID=A0ABR0MH44_GOSAR|nr:hypothetical protein PVK06_048142 [Gossypium arboreum]